MQSDELSQFDRPVERHGTGSLKWSRYEGRDVLPMWVADMDFVSPEPVLASIRRRLDHGVLGYSVATAEAVEAREEILKAHKEELVVVVYTLLVK
jgi:cystathionine beta-lyase